MTQPMTLDEAVFIKDYLAPREERYNTARIKSYNEACLLIKESAENIIDRFQAQGDE